MITAVIAAAGITALAVFFFLAEWDDLTEGHARPAAHILNAARWGFVIALCWVLIPTAFSAPAAERAATMVGLAALIGAFMLVPVRWFVRVGGREPVWELRQLRAEVTRLSNKIRRDAGSVPPDRLRELIAGSPGRPPNDPGSRPSTSLSWAPTYSKTSSGYGAGTPHCGAPS